MFYVAKANTPAGLVEEFEVEAPNEEVAKLKAFSFVMELMFPKAEYCLETGDRYLHLSAHLGDGQWDEWGMVGERNDPNKANERAAQILYNEFAESVEVEVCVI